MVFSVVLMLDYTLFLTPLLGDITCQLHGLETVSANKILLFE